MIYNKTHIYKCSATFDLIDFGGVVYHPHYLVLCERARGDALKKAGYPFEELFKDGYAMPLRENYSEYFRPIYLGENLVILTTIKEVNGIRLSVTQNIMSENDFLPPTDDAFFQKELYEVDPKKMIYRLTVTLVSVKINPIKPARFPQKLIEALQLPV